MAAKKNPLADKARELYKSGKRLVDIAAELQVPDGTVRRWKSTYQWDDERSESKIERSVQKKSSRQQALDDGTKETLANDELTEKQKIFCVYYARTFNATQSYLTAYGGNYETAMTNGCRLLGNEKVKKEITRLKEIKRQQIVAGAEDIVELQMRIAFADMGNYVKFGSDGVRLKDSQNTDTQLVREVKQGKAGISLKLADQQKAIEWLSKYFIMHPDDKYKAEYDRKRAAMDDNAADTLLQNMQIITDILQHPAKNRTITQLEGGEDEQTGPAE